MGSDIQQTFQNYLDVHKSLSKMRKEQKETKSLLDKLEKEIKEYMTENDMDSIAALIPDSLDDEMKSPVKVIPGQIALLNGSYSISGFDMPTPTTNGDGFTSWTPKLNLGSMNNRVTGITFWAITGSFSVWCTKKNFKGMKNFYWGFPFFGGRYILTDVRWNNNFMSVY